MRTRLVVAIVMLALAVAAACSSILAQQPTKPADKKPAKQEEVIIDAKHGRKSWGPKKTTLLEGDVKCVHGDTTLTTDRVEFDEDAQIVTSPGKLFITSPECDITGDKGTAYLKKRIAVLEGNVVMQLKPKKTEGEKADKDSPREKFNQPTTITCSKIEYLYKKKIASGTGNVIFKQDKRTATAQKFTYDEMKEELVVMGNVKAVDEDGQTFSAPEKVIISLKKGSEFMEAPNATATIKVDLSAEDETESGE